MKKFYWSFLTIMMVVFMGVNLVSCSDDDDKDNNGSYTIVGNWIKEYEEPDFSFRVLWLLREDGTFRIDSEGFEYGKYNSTSFSGIYEYTGRQLTLFITKSYDPDIPVGSYLVANIKSLTRNTLQFYEDEDGFYFTRTNKTSLW